MTSQRIKVMSSFNYISYWLTLDSKLVIKGNSFFYSDLKVVLLVAAPASLERFTFFLLGLSDLDGSVIFNFCFEYFSNDSFMSKNAQKKKPIIKLKLLVHKEKKNNKLLKPILKNFLFK